MKRNNIALVAAIAAILICAIAAAAQPKAKVRHRPVTGASTTVHLTGAGNTTQFGADMMEGTNIRQQQPAGGGKVPTGAASSSGTPSTDRRPNRRHFDHIGNKNTNSVKVKPHANQIGADMMEGNNIKQQQPAKEGKSKPASGLVTIPTDYPNIKPKPKTASHARPRP